MTPTYPQEDRDCSFLLVVSGWIHQASFLASWQEFKDNMREIVVKAQPGWADVYANQQGKMQGWASLRHREDVVAAFSMCSSATCAETCNRRLYLERYCTHEGMLVHVWETCRSSGRFWLLRCNCSKLFAEVRKGYHSAARCEIDIGGIERLASAGRATYRTDVPQYMSAGTTNGWGQSTMTTYTATTSFGYAIQPIYTTNTYGLSVNVENGAVLTEACGIFIQNLSFKCTPTDLNRLLLTVGRPVEQRLLKNPRTGVFKGAATARFQTQEQAHAALHLHGKKHMGMTISVRMDKETTAVGQVRPPLVVSSYYC